MKIIFFSNITENENHQHQQQMKQGKIHLQKKNRFMSRVVVVLLVLAVMIMVGVVSWHSTATAAATDYYDDRPPRLTTAIRDQYFSSDDYDGGNERYFAIHKLIRLACESHHHQKPLEVEISIQDRGSEEKGVYTFCYPQDRPELAPFSGPDWCCYWWKSASIDNYLKTARVLETLGKTTTPTTDKAGWVGNLYSPLPDVPEAKTRPLLQRIAQKHPSLLEVIHVSPIHGQIDNNSQNYLSLEEQVRRYKYLIDIGGNGYSGRLKMILWSGRPILLVKRRYVEYFQKDLVPYQHYIPVKEDLSDLVHQLQWCRSHPDEVASIGRNAVDFAKNHFSLEILLEDVYRTVQTCLHYKKHQRK